MEIFDEATGNFRLIELGGRGEGAKNGEAAGQCIRARAGDQRIF